MVELGLLGKQQKPQNSLLLSGERDKSFMLKCKATNMMGKSNIVRKKYVVSDYAPPKPEPVTEVMFTKSGNRETTCFLVARTE